MSHAPDHSPGPRPDDLDALRDGLRRRSARGAEPTPGGVYARARRRADHLYRRQVGAGLAVTVLVVGALVGAVTFTHGRATVGTEVGGGGVGDTATTSPGLDGSTTTVGPLVPDGHPCGTQFFTAADEAALVLRFGPQTTCVEIGDLWLVLFGGPDQPTTVAAVQVCGSSDTTCLDPEATHQPADFQVTYLPPVSTRSLTVSWGKDANGQPRPQYQIDFHTPLRPDGLPDGKPTPALQVTAGAGGQLTLELIQACAPQGPGPEVDHPREALTPVPATQALDRAVPAWSTIMPSDWTTTC